VAKDNITVKADLAQWWTLFSDGAEPLVDPEDAEFVAQAMALLPPRPWTTETWGQWTTAVKDATGRKGKGLFRPLRRALTGRDAGPEMADVMPLLQKLHARLRSATGFGAGGCLPPQARPRAGRSSRKPSAGGFLISDHPPRVFGPKRSNSVEMTAEGARHHGKARITGALC
jgi:hypothetical protein